MAEFSWSLDDYIQCGKMEIAWNDGSSPWSLDIVPVDQSAGARFHRYEIDGTSPQYELMDWPAGTRGLAAMSSSVSGTGSSVLAQLFSKSKATKRFKPVGKPWERITDTFCGLAVGSSTDTDCIDRNANDELDFYFSLSTDEPVQCGYLDVSWTSNFTAPASILMYVVGGEVYNIYTTFSNAVTTYSFPVALPSGSQFLLVMTDAGLHGLGGNSRIMTVGSSYSTSCLTTTPKGASSTTSTTLITSITSTATRSSQISSTRSALTSSSPLIDAVDGSRSGVSTAAIAGSVAGGVAVLAIGLTIGILLCLRRKRQKRAVGNGNRPDIDVDHAMTEDSKAFSGAESAYYTPTPLVYDIQTEGHDVRSSLPRYTVMSE